MSILPDSRKGKLEFFESHWETWLENATSIGLNSTIVNQLKTYVMDEREAFNAATLARDTSRSATNTWYVSSDTTVNLGRDLIKTIKAFAETSGNPNVYSLANIPAPVVPGPVGPPGTPMDFKVALRGDGALLLSWKCVNPVGSQGTIYEVRRKVAGQSAFEFLGANGPKKFTDASIAAGSSNVMYEITAVRSTVRGAPAQFVVNFGVGGDGAQVVSIAPMSAMPVKMAA